MSQKRINLCFDDDDPKQKAVYELLLGYGRRKTKICVDLLWNTLADEEGQSISENAAIEEISLKLKKALTILSRIEKIIVEKKIEEMPPENGDDKQVELSEPDNVNDDAYNSIMSMFNMD